MTLGDVSTLNIHSFDNSWKFSANIRKFLSLRVLSSPRADLKEVGACLRSILCEKLNHNSLDITSNDLDIQVNVVAVGIIVN